MTSGYHEPVMLSEALQSLDIHSDGIYIDATFGGGGHSRRILSSLGENGKLVAFDRDPDAWHRAAEDSDFSQAGDKFVLIGENFSLLRNHLRFRRLLPVDGILADLGVSSHQFDVAERGFSTRLHGPLDMRMDRSGDLTAALVLNTYAEEELKRIFCVYGEIAFGGRLAREVVSRREEAPFVYTDEAAAFFERFAQKGKENKFLAMVFQALRIEVNKELESLEALLTQSLEVLKPGGRLVVISYHSLEDRLVKNFMRTGRLDGKEEKDFYGNNLSPIEPVVRKVMVPSPEEIERNPRSRSAKLRVARIKPVEKEVGRGQE